jgi:hypothetical protein
MSKAELQAAAREALGAPRLRIVRMNYTVDTQKEELKRSQ